MAAGRNQAVPLGPGRLQRVLREALMLLCVGITVFLLVALISYDINDPGWSSSGSGGPTSARALANELHSATG